ncbi:MAG: DinB family protein [Anaerolineae bacterium]|nr:DinB family protein [Anaerolineae bacterium]
MHADAFRKLYAYHFAVNRKLWDEGISALSDAQFTQELAYSLGSVRNQVVHMVSVDERWFAGLRGVEVPDFLDPVHFPTRKMIRAHWDGVEADMRAYLDALTDETVRQPFHQFTTWQVLFHLLNHGTDHRAQLLAALAQLGAPTTPQDYIKYVMGQI